MGTSGWQYAHWRGSFYPQNLPQKDWLRYYAKYFDTVEVNSSFYRQTRLETFKKWQEETPEGFVFAVKGNKFITHIKRLKDCQEAIKVFFEAANSLGGSTSREVEPHRGKHVILWQLPPSLVFDEFGLKNFLDLLPQNFRHAFEFRHKSWLEEKTWKILKRYGVVAVFQDWHEWPQIREITADFIYIRFHGSKILYSSEYMEKELREWGRKIDEWMSRRLDVYAYFNNDAQGFTIPNAQRLKELVNST